MISITDPARISFYFYQVMGSRNKIIFYFLLLIAFHFAHVLEETWGHFWLIDAVHGLGLFLFINWLLIFIPLILLYFVIIHKRPAYYLSIAYVVFMVLNGLGHNIATLVTGRYFNGFAGGLSGLGLIIIGIPLTILLYKNIPEREAD
jgi:hypothetical protein